MPENVLDNSFSEETLHRVDEPFARLQCDVAREAVADYHVGIALVHFARSTFPMKFSDDVLSS
jgi:hypothetical protein